MVMQIYVKIWPDDNIGEKLSVVKSVKISKNTEKSPGNLLSLRLAKNHQLKLA